jgi:hypothetical protein
MADILSELGRVTERQHLLRGLYEEAFALLEVANAAASASATAPAPASVGATAVSAGESDETFTAYVAAAHVFVKAAASEASEASKEL